MGRVVLINGAFGVGKSAAADALVRSDRRLTISDPERIGYVLRRLPAWLPWSTRHLDDYQRSPLWRKLAIDQANRHAARSPWATLLPLCITDRGWLDTLRSGIEAEGHRMDAVCLIASWDRVQARLATRGVLEHSAAGRWVLPRARDALAAHATGCYGTLICTETLDVVEVAALLRRQILESA